MRKPKTLQNEQCWMQNLNWGYQIVDPTTNRVAMEIQDNQTGPERSEACTAKAKTELARITKILASYKLTTTCRVLLIDLIQANGKWVDTKKSRTYGHWNTAKALLRKGLATRNKYMPDMIRLSDEYLNENEPQP